MYSAAYDSQSHTLTVQVPDSTALVLTYQYTLKGFSAFNANTSISNSVSLDGQWSQTVSQSVAYRQAGAVASQGEFYLYKVDADNYSPQLSGAKFSLYSGASGSFALQTSDITVDGVHKWDLLSNDTGQRIFQHDVLYKFVETQAPEGYQKSDMPIYVVWLNQNETEDDAWSPISNFGVTVGITRSDVRFIPYGGGSIYVPNTYSRLTAQKIWTSPDGTELPDDQIGVSSITVNLYQDVKKVTQSTDACQTVAITKDGDWKYTWDNLPKKNDAGQDVVYRVEEEGLEHSYRASYLNNDVQTGTITINNTQAYQLPKTGGIGDMLLVAGGAALAAAAVAAFAVLRRRIS